MAEWIDSAASSELPILRSRGEDQALEFMPEFPSNARELAKEIAAFASTNPGMILIGISDAGELVGIPSATDSRSRDSLVRRIEGPV
jgi:ATP-dependent DNA helicase RecG